VIPDPPATSAETFGLPPCTPHLIAKLRNMTPERLAQIFPTEKDPK
jgi:hypothetical protein